MTANDASDPGPHHVFAVRVYYEDTDFSGAVYHASYLRFMERARTEMLRAVGVHQRDAFHGDIGEAYGFMVRAMAIDWRRPARMDDMLSVETRIDRVAAAALELDQRVLRDGERLVEAKARIAFVVGGRAARIPPSLKQKLAGLTV